MPEPNHALRAAREPAQLAVVAGHAMTRQECADRPGTTEALNTARGFADREPSDVQWPWVFAFTSAKAARYEASALAWLGDVRAARLAHVAALPAMTAPKPQALAEVEHAQLFAGAGRPDEAARLGVEALEVGREYGSERIIQRVTALHAELPRGSDRRDLGERLNVLYGGDFS